MPHSTDRASTPPSSGGGTLLHLFDDDRRRIIAHLGTTKAALYKAIDPVTGRPVIPGKGEYNTYTFLNVPDARMRLHQDTDWVFRFAAHCCLGGLAAIAVGLKVGFELWYATTLQKGAMWASDQTLREALNDHPPTDQHVDEFAVSSHYREVVVPGILAGLREHLVYSAHPRHVPLFPALNPASLPTYLTDGIHGRWPLLPIFMDGRACGHLTDPKTAAPIPAPDQVERKCVIPKERALPLVDAVMRAVLGVDTVPFGWHDVGALAEYPEFAKGGDQDGITVEPIPSAKRRLSKDDCVLVQHSVIPIADTAHGRYVPGIARRSLSADNKPRISSGASFLVSVACPPTASVQQVERTIWDTLHSKLFYHARTSGTLEPRGILLNAMSSKAVPDLSDGKARSKFKEPGERPYERRPFYLMLIWTCRVEGKPVLKATTANNALNHEDTIDEFWLPLRELTLLDMDLYGERAILHALLHDASPAVVGNGSAWFIDFNHADNAAWKAAFDRPKDMPTNEGSNGDALPRQ